MMATGLLSVLATPALAEGRWHAADAYYDPADMAAARRAVQAGSGGQKTLFFQSDRFEYQSREGSPILLWDLQGWYGGDTDKLWLKSEGELDLDASRFEEAEVQALYSRAISPYFDLQAGIRHDLEPGPSTSYGVLGIQGLVPYRFEVDAATFLSEDGDLTARIEAEYELLLTQRLILQPRAEIALSLQDVPQLGVGSGLGSLQLGARLRYEFDRQFAPYIGVAWTRDFGDTADFTRAEGGDPAALSFVAGVRIWY